MNIKTKIKILNRLVFYITFLIIWIILDIDFNDFPDSIIKAGICGALAWILTPKINNYKTQSGNQMQLKWIFSKRTINI